MSPKQAWELITSWNILKAIFKHISQIQGIQDAFTVDARIECKGKEVRKRLCF